MTKSKIDGKNGQVIIIILLILVVVLTVGLSIATRTVTDIKLSKQSELSQRAFNAAEAGIETVLQGQAGTNGQYVNIGTGTNTPAYNVSVTTVGGSNAAFVFNKPITKDDTQQIWFVGHNSDNSFNLSDANNFKSNLLWAYWGNAGQHTDNTKDPGSTPSITPALELSVIYSDSSGYKIARGAFDPNTNRASNNHFDSSSIDSTGGYTNNKLQFRRQIDFCAGPFLLTCVSGKLDSGITLYGLRMRLLYNDVPQFLGAQPVNATDTLPVQGSLISSTGNAGDVYRKVEVFQSYPVLPPLFDYVIFNGSSNSLSK